MKQEDRALPAEPDRAVAASPSSPSVSPVPASIPSAVALEQALRIAGGNASLALLLLPSLEDAEYNREYEAKGLSAWDGPEYRPYCLSCRTMRRMEHRDFGYECSACHAKCGPRGEPAQAIEARRAETQSGSVHESAVAKGHAPGDGQ